MFVQGGATAAGAKQPAGGRPDLAAVCGGQGPRADAAHPDPTATPTAGEFADTPTERLEEEICELSAHLAAASCRWLLLLAELERRRAHEAWGFWSASAWVAWRCGVEPRTAREQLRVARALGELPAVREAFGRGELTYSKVRAITRIATPPIEASLLHLARYATASQLERLVRGYRRASAPKDALARHSERFLCAEWADDGSLMIRGRLCAEQGALFLKALEAGREAARERREKAEGEGKTLPADAPRPARRSSNADALVEIAEHTLAKEGGIGGVRSAPERHQVVVHADLGALAGTDEAGNCRLEDGPAICAESARRLACDASLIPILHDGKGGVLDVGRKRRTVPPSLRRALYVRDRGRCRFPGCENRRWVEAHHIVHWAEGGKTKLSNLLLLGSHHHRLLHEGGFSVMRGPNDSLLFRRPGGRPIASHPKSPAGSVAELRARNRGAGLAIGPKTALSLGHGERFDYELAVSGLVERAERAGPSG